MAASSQFGAGVRATINYYKRHAGEGYVGVGSISGDMRNNKEKGTAQKAREMLEPQEMLIQNGRAVQDTFSLDTHGFCFRELHSALPQSLDVLLAEDEQQIQEIYWPEVEELARTTIRSNGLAPKYVFAIGTQKFTEDRSRGFLGSYSRQAHADFSDVVFDNAHKMLVKRGVPEKEAQRMDIAFINCWQPFGCEVFDNHLALLDWCTVEVDSDVVEKPRGSPIIKGHIYTTMIHHNPRHQWVYLPKMMPHEVIMFKQGDSRSSPGLAKYAFHTAIRDPTAPPDAPGRRSISVRLICAFERPPAAAL